MEVTSNRNSLTTTATSNRPSALSSKYSQQQLKMNRNDRSNVVTTKK